MDKVMNEEILCTFASNREDPYGKGVLRMEVLVGEDTNGYVRVAVSDGEREKKQFLVELDDLRLALDRYERFWETKRPYSLGEAYYARLEGPCNECQHDVDPKVTLETPKQCKCCEFDDEQGFLRHVNFAPRE